MNGAQWLVKTLRDRGVENVFVLCGNGLDPFLKACNEFNIRLIDTRNEQSASYMADAWGRMTGKLGVVAVSSGPGHTNTITGIANSFWDGGPMLLISGCSSQNTRGLDNFQEIDQVGIVAPITKYATMVQHIAHLPYEVNKAISTAVTGRPGPVHLTIPADIFGAQVDESKLRDMPPPAEVSYKCHGDIDLIEDAVKTLSSAKKPFMVVGSGAFYSKAWNVLSEFAKLTDIPIVSHIWDRGCIEKAIPQYMGVTNDELNFAMRKFSEADAIIIVGARIDYRLSCGLPTGFPKNAKVIRIDAEPSEINRALIPDVGIVGNPRSVLEKMLEEAKDIRWDNTEWLAEVIEAKNELIHKWDNLCHENVCPMPSLRIIREVKKALDQDVTFLLDGGNIGRWAHMMLFDRHPSHWFTCGASGAVGWGISGAVALKMARPNHPLLLLSGDGSAGFNVTEIETALRFKTPYVAVIAHDNAWGIVADGQGDACHVACEFGEIRFDKVAQALGAEGIYIDDPNKLAPSIQYGLKSDKVVIIHVPTQLAGISFWEERFGNCK